MTSLTSRSLTVLNDQPGNALAHTREVLERMILDIVQSAQTANTPAQQVQVPFEQVHAIASTSTAGATRFLKQPATSSTSRFALTRPPLQFITPSIMEALGTAHLPPKPNTRVPPLEPTLGSFAGPSSALLSTASTTTTACTASHSMTQPRQVKTPARKDSQPSPGWRRWSAKEGNNDDMGGDVDQPMEDLLSALAISQAELLVASL